MMNILEEVRGCQTIGISGHIRPDGDCAGSCLGMALYLQKAMPGVRVDVFLENFSDALTKNLAGAEEIRHDYVTDLDHYDAFLCLDCEKERLGDALDLFMKAEKKINIDHHRTNSSDTDYAYVDPDAAATGEIIYDIITAMGDEIDAHTGEALYAALTTDTGNFQYSNCTKKTHEIAAALYDSGMNHSEVCIQIYENVSVGRIRLDNMIMNTLDIFADGKIFTGIAIRDIPQWKIREKRIIFLLNKLSWHSMKNIMEITL